MEGQRPEKKNMKKILRLQSALLKEIDKYEKLVPKLFTDEEIDQIAIAVKNHSRKEEVGSPLEEIVKDADVLDFYQYGYDVARKEQQDRLEALLGHKVAGLKFSE